MLQRKQLQNLRHKENFNPCSYWGQPELMYKQRPKRQKKKNISHWCLTLYLNVEGHQLLLIFQSYTFQTVKNIFIFCFPEAVPSELVCENCQEKVLEAVGKMIHVMEEQMSPGVQAAVETGRNILNIIGAGQLPSPA